MNGIKVGLEDAVTGELMCHADVTAQATRVDLLLVDVWNHDFPETFSDIDSDAMLGMALAHAVHQGWIEPDPAMSPYLESAEALLGSADFDD